MTTRLEGPVTGGRVGRPWGSPLTDLEPLGYVEEEWLLDGEATTYELAPGTEATVDGRWATVPVDAIPYRTRVVVRRPSDPARFNGTVVVSWSNVSAGYEIMQWDGPELVAEGFVMLGVSAQRVGLTGYKADPRGLLAWDPERYGSLSIPTDAASYGIFADAIRLVAPGVDGLLDGYDVRRVVATGASQSAMRLHTYLNAVHQHVGLVDGYIFDVYGGSAAPINRASAEGVVPIEPGRLRDDTGARVLHTNSETEAISYFPFRRADDDRFVYWEIAGMAHGGASGQIRTAKNMRDWGFELGVPVDFPDDIVPNELDKEPVEDASLRWMQRWLTEGTRPPSLPPIEVGDDPLAIQRDEHGIARGGLRLPQVDVPIAVLAGVNDGPRMVQLSGMTVPFPAEKLRALYADHADYVARFRAAADAAVAAGYLLPRDAEKAIANAEAAPVP